MFQYRRVRRIRVVATVFRCSCCFDSVAVRLCVHDVRDNRLSRQSPSAGRDKTFLRLRVFGCSSGVVSNLWTYAKERLNGDVVTENLHYEERSGRPNERTDEIVLQVDQKLRYNRRLTIGRLISSSRTPSTVYTIVTENLRYRKSCARRLPKILTDQYKEPGTSCERTFSHRYGRNGDDLTGHRTVLNLHLVTLTAL